MSTPMELIKKRRAQAVHSIIEKGYLKTRICICMSTGGLAAGAQEVYDVFKNAIEDGSLKDVYLSPKGCAGRCSLDPMVEVIMPGKIPIKYQKITPDRAREIIERHLKNGEVIKDWQFQ